MSWRSLSNVLNPILTCFGRCIDRVRLECARGASLFFYAWRGTYVATEWLSGFLHRLFVVMVLSAVTIVIASVFATYVNTDLESNGIIVGGEQKMCIFAKSLYVDLVANKLGIGCAEVLANMTTRDDDDKSSYVYAHDGRKVEFSVCKVSALFCNLSESDKSKIPWVAQVWPLLLLWVSVVAVIYSTYMTVSQPGWRASLRLFVAAIGIAVLFHVYEESQVGYQVRELHFTKEAPPMALRWEKGESSSKEYRLGQFELTNAMKTKLDVLAGRINQIVRESDYNAVLIEGHTDGVPIRKGWLSETNAYHVAANDVDSMVDQFAETNNDAGLHAGSNIELGYLRAVAVMNYMRSKLEVKAIHVASFGCNKSVHGGGGYSYCASSGDDADQRRVVLRLYRYDSVAPDAYSVPRVY